MAEIVQSLFGVTPQSYQQAQQQRADAQAFQYAQMSPFQQANYAIGRGATGLSRVIGGALGGTDPELQRITARQQIAKQINPNNPASIQQGIAALQQSGDSQGAFMLQDEYRKMVESGALVGQREASAKASLAQAGRERVQGIPADIQVAAEISDLQEQIGQFTALPASPERDQALRLASNKLAELQRLTTKEPKEDKGPGFGEEAERESKAKFGKRFAELTPTEAAVVNKTVTESKKSVSAAGAPRLPGAPVKTKDWMDFSTKILSGDPTMVRTNTIISDAPSAIETIRMSTTNDISAASLPSALAQLTGQGKNMSNQDVQRFARTGGLDDRLAQDAVKFFTGGTTKVKKDQAEKFATALYRGALIEQKARLQNQAEQFGYLDSPNYRTALRQIDAQLGQFKLKTKGSPAESAAPSSGLSVAEQAELDQLKARFGKGAK